MIRLWNMDLGQDIKRICAVTWNTPTADEWRRHIDSSLTFPAPCWPMPAAAADRHRWHGPRPVRRA
ncbi:hypothetical protein [Nonomuraea sp. NPDC049684]|uniref:hypothetical protein n=1 Tax=unclassified Nonomuraea TaxID=2593643 RepID=UPI0037A7B867